MKPRIHLLSLFLAVQVRIYDEALMIFESVMKDAVDK